MRIISVHRTLPRIKSIFGARHSSQVAVLNQDEYTETPEYPPIVDGSLEARKLRERQSINDKIQKLNTVEEKQIALNMPRYYGWKCLMFKEDSIPYNAMPMVQCYTRTHFSPIKKLPEVYNDLESVADLITKDITSMVEDAIAFELDGIERNFTASLDKPEASQREDTIARCVVKQINRIICNNLADKSPHILSSQVDYDPRLEAFWMVGGMNPPRSVVNWRRQYSWLKDRLHEPIDRPVQYIGKPFLTIRNHLPLKPIMPYSDAENPEFKVEKYNYAPQNIGYNHESRHGTNIPGYWPGDTDEYGLLSIHGRGHILDRKASFGPEDNVEALHSQAIKNSFGWLLAQANYQGFTTYNDVTYPLVSQTVITNGQVWSFYAYQLNTISMHNEQMDQNPKHNVCFGTKPLHLYETLEDGKVKGLNEDVLKMLVQFYLNSPEQRDHEMKPYLAKDEQVVADIEDDNRRNWLENRYKSLVSNKPRHNPLPEIYMWEKIYKIKFQTRFFERRVRPFELGINPYNRRLNEHLPPYIPKVLRPYPKSKKKFETTYYPDV